MAKTKKITIGEGDVKGRTPRSMWAMTQASMAHRPGPKSKVCKKRGRLQGKSECDRRNW
jgi:hypothetical protein